MKINKPGIKKFDQLFPAAFSHWLFKTSGLKTLQLKGNTFQLSSIEITNTCTTLCQSRHLSSITSFNLQYPHHTHIYETGPIHKLFLSSNMADSKTDKAKQQDDHQAISHKACNSYNLSGMPR